MRTAKDSSSPQPSCARSGRAVVASELCSDVIDPSPRYSNETLGTQREISSKAKALGALAELRHPSSSTRVGFRDFLD